jgi:predicted Zn-dependent protease
MKLDTDKIVVALARRSDISGWTVTRRHRRGAQLYAIGRDVESVRQVEAEDFSVTVYHDHPWPDGRDGPSARGVATVKLVSGDLGNLDTRLEDAVVMASLVNNVPWELVAPGIYPVVPLADASIVAPGGTTATAWRMAEEIWDAVDREARTGVRLSAAENFVTVTDHELVTSRGVRAHEVTTHLAVEVALLARGSRGGVDDEAETFRPVEGRRVADLRLSAHVAEAATFARDTLRADATPSHDGPVVIAAGALPALFDPLLFHTGAQAAVMKLARLSPGDRVTDGGDPLQLSSDPTRPFGLGSHAFDSDGVPAQAIALIRDGVVASRHASSRYAQYLGVPVTGGRGATVIAGGPTSGASLVASNGAPVIEVVAFSAPNVDDITGDIGSEIRLAYVHRPGGSVHPVKGGAVAGNAFDAFRTARFSAEIHEALVSGFGDGGTYVGPRLARFDTLRVAGD